MLTIQVRVAEARDRTALVTLAEGRRTIARDVAAASAAPEVAAERGNPACDPLRPFGHPPYGTYRLLQRSRTPPGCEVEYGTHLLVFESEAGPALEAESFGRLGLLAYAGPSGGDARLRRTQGGVRLTEKMMRAIVSRLGPEAEVELRIVPLRPRRWWAFWRRRETTLPLSAALPRLVAPVLDEASLTEQLLRGVVRRSRRREPLTDDESARSRTESDRGRPADQEPPFQAGGGAFGGAGASASWDDAASGAGRPPGVDAAGRIVGTAAAAAALGVAAAASGGTAGGSAGADAPPSPPDTSSEATGTQTSTTY